MLWLKIRQERTIGRAGSGSELAIFKQQSGKFLLKTGHLSKGFEGDKEMSLQTAVDISYTFICQLHALQTPSPTLWLAFSLSLRYILMKKFLFLI